MYEILSTLWSAVCLLTLLMAWQHEEVPWKQGLWGPHGAYLGPTGPRWAPCGPCEPCYLGRASAGAAMTRFGFNTYGTRTLTHWGRVTHTCVSKQTIIGSDNGLSPGRHQAIIWTNVGILLIGTLGRNFSQILIEIRIFSFKKMGFKVSSAKWRSFCLGLNVLSDYNVVFQQLN